MAFKKKATGLERLWPSISESKAFLNHKPIGTPQQRKTRLPSNKPRNSDNLRPTKKCIISVPFLPVTTHKVSTGQSIVSSFFLS
ncbi:MAG TPA: hypothetical protein VF177_06910, partial [Anaerolineae bacterium]